MRLKRTVYDLFTIKEMERKNIVHKLSDMTDSAAKLLCIQSNFKYTQYIKLSQVERKSRIRQEAGLIIDVFQLIPKLNEHNSLFASAWLCILGRLKYKKTV